MITGQSSSPGSLETLGSAKLIDDSNRLTGPIILWPTQLRCGDQRREPPFILLILTPYYLKGPDASYYLIGEKKEILNQRLTRAGDCRMNRRGIET